MHVERISLKKSADLSQPRLEAQPQLSFVFCFIQCIFCSVSCSVSDAIFNMYLQRSPVTGYWAFDAQPVIRGRHCFITQWQVEK